MDNLARKYEAVPREPAKQESEPGNVVDIQEARRRKDLELKKKRLLFPEHFDRRVHFVEVPAV
jgi:hypothetical protein